MRLYGSSATTAKSVRRHARAHRPVAAFDTARTTSRRRTERRPAVDQPATTPVPKLIPRSA